ncbi:importin subunit beta-2 [Trichomonascus vanleenenianus]|uniref:Kap104p n=1 Tax=Trichomonascus vanleenenianus TaxID=2268995 RepID=UPI003ECB2FBB
MSHWQPQADSVRQLIEIVEQAVSVDVNARKRASKALEEAKKQADFDNYLVYLLVNASSEARENARATAGTLLRQNIASGQFNTIPAEAQQFIQTEIVKGLYDPKPLIRTISSNSITALVSAVSIAGWPSILPRLMQMAEGSDGPDGQQGAMAALARICEDSAHELNQDYNGEKPLSYMVPKFLEFSTHSTSPKIRAQSVFCLIQFVINPSQILFQHIDAFLNALFSLATDPDSDTRKNVCSAFVNLLEMSPDKLLPHLEGVVNYALHCIQDKDEDVASEGGEFVLALSDSTIEPQYIQPHLARILPVILPAMVYSEDDRAILEAMAEDDELVADRAEDIAPTSARAKEQHKLKTTSKPGSSEQNGETTTNNDESDDDDDEDEEDEDLGLADWSLRKCCAASFDILATRFGNDVLQISMPYLKDNVSSQEWYVREASILGFGAIAEGCITLLSPHLSSLVPFLVERLSDDQAPVRQIACWTIGRYSSWIVEHTTPQNQNQLFLPVLQGLLKCCLDKNKKVQESGCSAFATLTEHAGDLLVPYIEPILQHFAVCFQKYQHKNLIILYDAVQTFTDHVSTALCEQKYIDLLLPPLMDKWAKLKDDDRDLWSLFECLSSVTATLGELFAPYAPAVFERAMRILRDNLMLDQHAQVDPQNVEPPEKDFIIISLDLLDGLAQGLGQHFSDLCKTSQPPLVEMMLVCFNDEVHEVRQSAFALLGDMVISTYDLIQPYFDQVMRAMLSQINTEDFEARRVCNNATWSAGEIALKASRDQLQPFAEELFQRLITVLNSETSPTVLENAAIALGRLGKSLSDLVAPHVGIFVDKWCHMILPVEETDEKDSAYRGMCEIVCANPTGITEGSVLKFIETIALYMEPSHELAMLISKVLEGYKSYISDWNGVVMAKLPQHVSNSLRQRYGV